MSKRLKLSGFISKMSLHEAAACGELVEVKKLLAGRHKINQKDCISGCTPLCVACEWGNISVAKLLIESGADVNNVCNEAGRTPLHKVCGERDNQTIAQLLIANGADLNITDNGGDTPFNVASYWSHLPIIQMLIESGSDVNTTDCNGWTSLHRACYVDDLPVAQLLIKSGADINGAGKKGRTPLHSACDYEDYEDYELKSPSIIKMLIEEAADVTIVDEQGLSPFQLAITKGYLEAAKDIFEAMGSQYSYNY